MDKDIIGQCICTRCGFSMPAPKEVNCGMARCPKCGSAMRNGGTGFNQLE